MYKRVQIIGQSSAYAESVVENNHNEERLARIEQMVEQLQRDVVAGETATVKFDDSVIVQIVVVGLTTSSRTLPLKDSRLEYNVRVDRSFPKFDS